MRSRNPLLLPLLAVLLLGATSSTLPERVAFRIITSTVTGERRDVVSEVVVEGPRATDFTIALDTGPYRMDASFLTDFAAGGEILMQASLDTRRLYGRSERNLPLYEIDRREREFTLAPGEQLVLLPFGGRGASERLEIEIAPERSGQRDANAPLDIRIVTRDPSGSIQVDAFRQPHRFTIDAEIVGDGTVVAKGSSAAFIRQPARIHLRPTAEDGGAGYILIPRIEPFDRAGSMLRIRFDLLQVHEAGRTRALARDWAGVATGGGALTYEIGDILGTGTSKLTLHIHTEGD